MKSIRWRQNTHVHKRRLQVGYERMRVFHEKASKPLFTTSPYWFFFLTSHYGLSETKQMEVLSINLLSWDAYHLLACLQISTLPWFCLAAFYRGKPDAGSWWICRSAEPKGIREREEITAPFQSFHSLVYKSMLSGIQWRHLWWHAYLACLVHGDERGDHWLPEGVLVVPQTIGLHVGIWCYKELWTHT